MQTVLFTSTIFGPIKSRRLGTSLGVNLMPSDGKICSFNCIYCEAGFNEQGPGTSGIPKREHVKKLLRAKLQQMSDAGEPLDSITFSGNGEPTLHPHFAEIVHDTLNLRNRFYPEAKVTVLSNATMAGRSAVADALRLVDNNVLKLDSAIAHTMIAINRPTSPNVLPAGVIADLAAFGGKCIVQTMLLRGEFDSVAVDNTTDEEIAALIDAYRKINPQEIMLYSIDRKTPAENLQKIDAPTMRRIADQITAAGFNVQLTV